MRIHVLSLTLVLTACGSEDAEPPEPPPEAPADDPVPEPVAVDDDNRFVREDLDRFLGEHPDALREADQERFRTCEGEACLVEPGAGVNPFAGAGIRYLVPLWLRGCLSGSAQCCMYAGRTYQAAGLGGPEEPAHTGLRREEARAKFRAYIARACMLSDAHCVQWAEFRLADESPSEADVARAIARLTASCESGDHHGCAALARHASDYPAIGAARGWWQRACAADDAVPSEPCSRYAQVLFATGDGDDRAAAVSALGPSCDVDASHWRRRCPGEREAGTEECDAGFLWKHGAACAGLAETLADEEALVMHAAICGGSLMEDVNATRRQSCAAASQLARSLRRPPAYRAALAARACEPIYYECLDERMDLEACGDARDACRASARGGQPRTVP